MNQPASKEPTMDEILSSIRQIIADDDDGKVPEIRAAAGGRPQLASVAEPAPAIDPFENDDEDSVVPLALSPEQIIDDESASADVVEDIELDAEMPSAESLQAAALVVPDDIAFEQDRDEVPVVEQPVSFAQGAPMPDADLSADLAEELLEPATKAAVRSAFSKLNSPKLSPEMTVGMGGLTIESMIREMMRPMLKDWLEENLPSMVERIVAQEIERVSRGGN